MQSAIMNLMDKYSGFFQFIPFLGMMVTNTENGNGTRHKYIPIAVRVGELVIAAVVVIVTLKSDLAHISESVNRIEARQTLHATEFRGDIKILRDRVSTMEGEHKAGKP